MKASRLLVMAGFLSVFALGFWVLSFVPGAPLVPGIAGLAWLGAAVFAGWKLFPEVPAARSPDLTVPEIFLPKPLAEEIEVLLDEDVLTPDSSGYAATPEPASVPEDSSADVASFLDLLDSIEAEWNRPDTLAAGLGEVSGNAAFIRENVQRSYEIADNLAGSAQRAFSLSEKVQKGVVVVTDALMQSLKQAELLSDHSERITGILQLMAEVSDKIHVLSINASIVSARAGTAGRGFEVVAKEIRSLARETEHSLGDIVEVINLLRTSISTVIDVVREADAETEQEKSSLIEVAGALQGVILGVEIVKAVSGFAKEKSDEQDRLVQGLASSRTSNHELKSKVAAVRARLEEWKLKE